MKNEKKHIEIFVALVSMSLVVVCESDVVSNGSIGC